VSGKKIAFLGWAFKKDTNDTRESAAIYVADNLMDEQAQIVVYDPKVQEAQMLEDLNYLNSRSEAENAELLGVAADAYAACKGAHAVAILTEWDEFKTLDWQTIYNSMEQPAFVFDGRKLLDAQQLNNIGFEYYAIGQ
jgi:UDPglucose 6-dehydrogenase